MWPWEHLAFGYLLYSALVRRLTDEPPSGREAVAVAFGTQFPDLIDKPLTWTFHVLPNSRSLAHSLLSAILLIALLRALLPARDRAVYVIPFGVGYLSHLVGDALLPAVSGEFAHLGFLLWPVIPAIPYEVEGGFIAHFGAIELSPVFLLKSSVSLLIVYVWYRDGMPGLAGLRMVPGWVDTKLRSRD